MTERECYTTKSIELHLFFGQLLLRQLSEISHLPEHDRLSSFEKKYKKLLAKTAEISDCLFHPPISLDDSLEIKYINQDVLLLLQKLPCISENLSSPTLEWEVRFYQQCILCLETESTSHLPRRWIKRMRHSNFF